MDKEKLMSWLDGQEKEVSEAKKIEVVRTEAFYSGALKAITAMKAQILLMEKEANQPKEEEKTSKGDKK